MSAPLGAPHDLMSAHGEGKSAASLSMANLVNFYHFPTTLEHKSLTLPCRR